MKNIFTARNAVSRPKLNKFDLGHEKKMSLNMGKLVPMFIQDVVPGDKIRVGSEIFMRFAPMIAPIMHRVNVYTHYFFVPNRIVWDEWQDFITGGEDGTANPIFPQFELSTQNLNLGLGSLADYMGIPYLAGVALQPEKISALPFRAYQLIYNEYYRDQNLVAKLDIPRTSGVIANQTEIDMLLKLRTRAWEKDYFTSALPWPQKGAEAGVPITSVMEDGVLTSSGLPPAAIAPVQIDPSGNPLIGASPGTITSTGNVLINELRKANRLQKWLEKQARGGGRYVETILSQFGIQIPDYTIQRPEYLGGGKQHVSISEVLSTFDNTAGDLPQGNMSGHGVSAGVTHGFSKSFNEHGYIIGIMSVMPKTAYQQGISKHFSKFDKFEFYWPEFAHLGEQEIKNKELFFDTTNAGTSNQETFGYTPRYAEYKFTPSTVHGDFRSSLAYWHIGRIFQDQPALNEEFITADNQEMDRIFAVVDPAQHKLWCQIYNSVDALRPMPYFATPDL